MLKEHVKKYFGETSLHGLKYIGEDGRHPLERLIWVILCCSGVCLAVFFMHPSREIGKNVKKYIFDPKTSSAILMSRQLQPWKQRIILSGR